MRIGARVIVKKSSKFAHQRCNGVGVIERISPRGPLTIVVRFKRFNTAFYYDYCDLEYAMNFNDYLKAI